MFRVKGKPLRILYLGRLIFFVLQDRDIAQLVAAKRRPWQFSLAEGFRATDV
jgi:hypothetical protein